MNVNNLIEVLSIQTCSNDVVGMNNYIEKRLSEISGCNYYIKDGNIYATKGYANYFPCIVAHTDTVHEIVKNLTVIRIGENLTGFNAVMMEQTGIGGDDKVGIHIALECLEKFENIKVAFFRDEEIGCAGSYDADVSFFKNCGFILQCDRNGNSDFITNAAGIQLSSKSFQKAVAPMLSLYNYRRYNRGGMTDVMALKELGISISMANISCGYYNPHSANEYVNVGDVSQCFVLVCDIIESLGGLLWAHTPAPKQKHSYEYIPLTEKLSVKGYYDNYCRDCWRTEAISDGLCKTCIQYYKDKYEYQIPF